jgi:hypothetical protein
MKNNFKIFMVAVIFATSMLYSSKAEARVTAQFAHVFENGCVGTHTYHSTLFGLYTWETYEVVAC